MSQGRRRCGSRYHYATDHKNESTKARVTIKNTRRLWTTSTPRAHSLAQLVPIGRCVNLASTLSPLLPVAALLCCRRRSAILRLLIAECAAIEVSWKIGFFINTFLPFVSSSNFQRVSRSHSSKPATGRVISLKLSSLKGTCPRPG